MIKLTPHGIKEVRYIMGWNRAAMGVALGVSPRTVKEWEMGHHYPGTKAQKLLQKIL
ncbi:MAG: hypothetical protein U9P07_00505 [Pseudomonadota bacterium]|nr:hypothetical protein [Pseudomonadota bacterium]